MFNKKGQSLMEVVLAVAIFGLICSTLVTMSLGGFSSLHQSGEYIEAQALAQQGVEAVRSIRDTAWNKIIYNNSAVTSTGNAWEFVGENTSTTVGKYLRTVNFSDVCRDVAHNIVACPGGNVDLNTKLITVNVSWMSERGATNNISKNFFLTNWESRDWAQTDWSSGSGQAIWSNASAYESDDSNLEISSAGEISLLNTGGGCGAKNWGFENSADYTFNNSEITVATGTASLSGVVVGAPIDANTVGLWHLDELSGNVLDSSGNNNNLTNVIGAPLYNQAGKFSTALNFGGNSSRYITNAQQTGLGITGAITIEAWIYRTTAASAIESIVSKWRTNSNRQSYALNVDNNNRLNFWLSSNGSASVGVLAASTVPLNQWVHVAGVYDGSNMYIFQNGVLQNSVVYTGGIANKLAFVAISGAENFNGVSTYFNGKIDEVRISNMARWTAGFSVPSSVYGSTHTYPTNSPMIRPNISHTAQSIDSWSSFTETATKNGGEIYYQLSDDDGLTWRYWDGSIWATSSASNYNTAAVINSNIRTFNTSTKKILFKSFLTSNGTQQVILDNIQVSCEKQYAWNFSNSLDYAFAPAKIILENGTAKLVDQGGGGICSGAVTACSAFATSPTCLQQVGCSWGGATSGTTTNPDFSTTLVPWTNGFWGNANPTRSRSTTGGNPGGYAKIQFPNTKNKLSGGYFQQSFVVSSAGSTGSINFNWLVSQYTGLADSLNLYVFVDTFSGTPTIGGAGQVWSSGNRTAVSSWATVSNLDISSKISTAGTYYLKIAAYVDYSATTRQYAVGFDNVLLNWSKPDFCSGTPTACSAFGNQTTCQIQNTCTWTGIPTYPTDKPTVAPTTVYSGNVNAWSTFYETATKNGGEIYYQLSTDGLVWQYWNGSAWTAAGATNYNIASEINTNITSFSTSTAQIVFKAFLSSNGSQQVILDNVQVGWGEGAGSGFATVGNFISSAFNMGNNSPVQILSWDQNISSCGSCNIKLQLRTAPNNAGVPGVWTGWYGESGAGSYFTNYLGTLLSTDLNGNQWVQYRAEFVGDGLGSPILQEVRVNYK